MNDFLHLMVPSDSGYEVFASYGHGDFLASSGERTLTAGVRKVMFHGRIRVKTVGCVVVERGTIAALGGVTGRD